MGVVDKVDEKLGSPGVRAGIGHGDGPPVILVCCRKFISYHIARPTRSRSCRVPPLYHEPGNDPMKDNPIVEAFLYQSFKIPGGHRHIAVEFNDDITEARHEFYPFPWRV